MLELIFLGYFEFSGLLNSNIQGIFVMDVKLFGYLDHFDLFEMFDFEYIGLEDNSLNLKPVYLSASFTEQGLNMILMSYPTAPDGMNSFLRFRFCNQRDLKS